MADVVLDSPQQSVSLAQQIRLVAGLRWKLLRNKLRKKNNRLDLIGMIIASVLGGTLVIGVSFGFFAATREFWPIHKAVWKSALPSICVTQRSSVVKIIPYDHAPH